MQAASDGNSRVAAMAVLHVDRGRHENLFRSKPVETKNLLQKQKSLGAEQSSVSRDLRRSDFTLPVYRGPASITINRWFTNWKCHWWKVLTVKNDRFTGINHLLSNIEDVLLVLNAWRWCKRR